MSLELIHEGDFKYVETKGGETNLLLLHGLFGALSNFGDLISEFGDKYNVVLPLLPIYDIPLRQLSVGGLVKHIEKFVEFKGYDKVNVLGNSLGGHLALLYAMDNPERIESVILTGSSGLFESAMGTSFPKRGNYEYIKKKTEDTFYRPEVASKELVDEVFGIVNNRNKAIRIIATAKSAVRHNLGERLHKIKAPTLLIWGNNDKVTPPFVGEKFHELIDNSELHFIDKCGHAPMMEEPEQFNEILSAFLKRLN
ncbi:MAG: alpha/beta hydrolase [Saprospiraceae bacterium]|nr:alpha/beta hydrolase [Saprospiraceae bacterium]